MDKLTLSLESHTLTASEWRWQCLRRELDMSNCSGLTDEALETLANSIAASHAQKVDDSQPQDAAASQSGHLSISDAFDSARAGNTSRFYIQVQRCVRHHGQFQQSRRSSG